MSIIGSNILAGSSGQAGAAGYQIEQSLRFDGSTSCSRTPSSAGNRKTWTFSFWLKRASLAGDQTILMTPKNSGYCRIDINSASGNSVNFIQFNGSTLDAQLALTKNRLRDPSAWYHIVVAVDTTQSTASNRVKFYINGSLETDLNPSFTTYPSQNFDLELNNTGTHYLGVSPNYGLARLNGYLAEVNYIDGSQLAATDFGEYDNNGVWRPIEYSGSYTGNSYYLKFDAADLGGDSSGLSNDFSVGPFVTSGTGTDVMSDTPTTNWCTLNPLVKNNNLSDGNLVYNTATAETAYSTFGVSSGKWYCEVTCNNANTWFGIGTDPFLRLNAAASNQVLVGTGGGTVYSQNSTNTYDAGATWTTNDVIGIALDADNGGCIFYKNNTRILEWDSFTVDGPYFFGFDRENPSPTTTHPVNFGQRAFAYTPPTNFLPLNTSNLPAPDIANGSKYFNTVLYSGTGATQSITGVGFQPDWIWFKRRSVVEHHLVQDAIRGVTKLLYPSNTSIEDTRTDQLTSFDTDGFTLGADTAGYTNKSGTYVAWNWLAGNGTSSNTDGSITSTVSANPTAGFSIVSFNSGASGAKTVGHGLGVAPQLIITKDRDNATNWTTYHASATTATDKYLNLNGTAAVQTASGIWGSTLPTSTVFGFGSGTASAPSADCIAYCFAEVEGYSKFGSYTGNGATSANSGPFVYLGFKPSMVIIKRTDGSGGGWAIWDNKRNTYNIVDNYLFPNTSGSEADGNGSGWWNLDFLSNGFRVQSFNESNTNASGGNYIFAAFAENPFGGSGVSPATAR